VDVIELVAGAAHALVAAAWFGAMVYSLAVVQPRSARFLGDDDRSEAYAATLASGARRPVLAVIALLLLSGATLLAIGASEDRSGGWWALMAVKGALLLAAAFVFWRVSWRLWPARVLALSEELPPLRRRFRHAALALTTLVGAGIVLGAAARAVA
jgi:uncharacterized membrane protein